MDQKKELLFWFFSSSDQMLAHTWTPPLCEQESWLRIAQANKVGKRVPIPLKEHRQTKEEGFRKARI